jgi:outer membrane protein TolC
VTRELVPLQERRRSEVEDAWRLGHVDVTDVLLAEQALLQAQSTRVGLEREASDALFRLERAVGGRAVLAGGSP